MVNRTTASPDGMKYTFTTTPSGGTTGSRSGSQRSYIRAVERMGTANGFPKECPGSAQVQSAGVLEHEAYVGRSRGFQLMSACSLIAAR
jgi:hypothetical protein